MITIIDSGIANVGSVLAAFRRIGAEARVTQSATDVLGAFALVLPGVGAFKDGMNSLHEHGLVEPTRRAVAAGTPILGICLGMQLLVDGSEEFGQHAGLGLIPGRAVRLTPRILTERVPNIGWCDVRLDRESRLFHQAADAAYYFVHSYHVLCADVRDSVASIEFGTGRVCAALDRGHIFGVQFHPEKSQDVGLMVLQHYAQVVTELLG